MDFTPEMLEFIDERIGNTKEVKYWNKLVGYDRIRHDAAYHARQVYTPISEYICDNTLYYYDPQEGEVEMIDDTINPKMKFYRYRSGEWVFNFIQNAFLNDSFSGFEVACDISRYKISMNSTWFRRIYLLLISELGDDETNYFLVHRFFPLNLEELIIEDVELALTILKIPNLFVRNDTFTCLNVYSVLKIASQFNLDKEAVLIHIFGIDPRKIILRLHALYKINSAHMSTTISTCGPYFEFNIRKFKNNLHLLL